MKRVAGTITPDRADENAIALVAMWEVGQDSLAAAPGRLAPAELRKELDRARSVAAGKGLNWALGPGTLGKIRTIGRVFDAAGIRDLAAAVRSHQSRFGPSHLARLMAVRDEKRRDRLMWAAVEGSWTVAALGRAVMAAREGRRRGNRNGRPPVVPDRAAERVLALEGLCLRWLRWTALARRPKGRLPAEILPLLDAADRAVEAIRAASASAFQR